MLFLVAKYNVTKLSVLPVEFENVFCLLSINLRRRVVFHVNQESVVQREEFFEKAKFVLLLTEEQEICQQNKTNFLYLLRLAFFLKVPFRNEHYILLYPKPFVVNQTHTQQLFWKSVRMKSLSKEGRKERTFFLQLTESWNCLTLSCDSAVTSCSFDLLRMWSIFSIAESSESSFFATFLISFSTIGYCSYFRAFRKVSKVLKERTFKFCYFANALNRLQEKTFKVKSSAFLHL